MVKWENRRARRSIKIGKDKMVTPAGGVLKTLKPGEPARGANYKMATPPVAINGKLVKW